MTFFIEVLKFMIMFLALVINPFLTTMASFSTIMDDPNPYEQYVVDAEIILASIVGYTGVYFSHVPIQLIGRSIHKFISVLIIALLLISSLSITRELMSHWYFRSLQLVIDFY